MSASQNILQPKYFQGGHLQAAVKLDYGIFWFWGLEGQGFPVQMSGGHLCNGFHACWSVHRFQSYLLFFSNLLQQFGWNVFVCTVFSWNSRRSLFRLNLFYWTEAKHILWFPKCLHCMCSSIAIQIFLDDWPIKQLPPCTNLCTNWFDSTNIVIPLTDNYVFWLDFRGFQKREIVKKHF